VVEIILIGTNANGGTRVDGKHELLYGTARQTMGCLTSSLYSIQENAPQLPLLNDLIETRLRNVLGGYLRIP